MIDLTHKNGFEFIQFILIIAVVCLSFGAISSAASAADYDWEFSVQLPEATPGEVSGTIVLGGSGENVVHEISNALSDGSSVYCKRWYSRYGTTMGGPYATLVDFITNPGIYTDFPSGSVQGYYFDQYWVEVGGGLSPSELDVYVRSLAEFMEYNTNIGYHSSSTFHVSYNGATVMFWIVPYTGDPLGFSYSYERVYPAIPFYVDVVDSDDDYLISVSGFDGTSIEGSAYYTISVSTYSGGYDLHLSSFPMYLGDSPVHFWPSDETFTLPVYLPDGVTPIDYYCILSFMGDPTLQGYPFWWNMTTSGSLEYPFNTTYPPVVPIPTPVIPLDIIPNPDNLTNVVNFTGWYQDQGFEDNNITAPIYSGMRGWFTINMIPLFDFYLMPIDSVASMISDSAVTSTDAISDSVEQLSTYAAPMNLVGGYVVLLVPDVVWVVVFAALSIGYVVLLIRITTGSIKNTISRFLGRW